MLLAVEGGGFFSSSASGYSKGLTLLLLDQKNEERPMRVTPWNQYQLVDQKTDPDIQLASGKNQLVGECAPFVCFGCSAAGPQSPLPLKVGPTQSQEVLPGLLDFDNSKNQAHPADPVDDSDDRNSKIDNLKSRLKNSVNSDAAAGSVVDGRGGSSSNNEALCEKDSEVTCEMERKKVQWTDTAGGKLFEVREFEMSEYGSDDEFDHRKGKTCACRIM